MKWSIIADTVFIIPFIALINFSSFLKHSLPSFLSPALFWVSGSVPIFKNYDTGEQYPGKEYSGRELTLAVTSPRDSYLGSECLLQGKSRAKQLDGPS